MVKSEMPNISRARWKADSGWMRGRGRTLERNSRGSRREKRKLTLLPYFCNYRNMKKPDPLLVTRSADRFAALGAEPRLAILRLLLSAHPTGMIAGEVQEELDITASMLLRYFEKLQIVGLV